MKEQDLPQGRSSETQSPIIGQATVRRLVLGLQMAQLPPVEQFSILQKAHEANFPSLDPEARDYFERQLGALHDFCGLD